MCVSLWRALKYERGESVWGKGFKHSIMDFGVTLYKCGAGQEKKCNVEKGEVDKDKLVKNGIGFVCPAIPLMKICSKLNERKEGTPQAGRTRLIKMGGAVFFFYVGWILVIFNGVVTQKEAAQEWGSVKGNETAPDGNFKYYVSNRHGYFHQWSNTASDRDTGDVIKYNTEVDVKAGEVPLKGTVAGAIVNVGVGEAWAHPMILSPFGWFMLLFLYCIYVTELRSEIRLLYSIEGSLFEDWLCSLLWPTVLTQLLEQLDLDPPEMEVKI
jgi:hypothetical protein